jgi:thioredoxin 1
MFDRKILKCILHRAIYFSVIFLLLSISFACNQNKPSNISQTTDSQEQTKTTAVKTEQSKSSSDLIAKAKNPQTTSKSVGKTQEKLPKLLDLGADKCIPCKMMKPILNELKTDYAGKLDVEFIDVWENPKESEKHGINLIPTQIFYDPEGKEFQRHEGFMSKEDILATFRQKGMKLD